MARRPVSIGAWIGRHLREDAPRTRSLIVTIFGDSVAPYRDGVWLGDLIELLRPFGANERLVRTSVYRLIEAGWLAARREGRRSYYTLAPGGRRRFLDAYHRVYTPPADWHGDWILAILPKADNGAAERTGLRRELEWEGFGSPAPGVFLRPTAETDALQAILEEQGLHERAAVLQARGLHSALGRPVVDLVSSCWELGPVAAGYAQFLDRFNPLRELIAEDGEIRPDQAFLVQTLSIDAFRRATLHDPRLPAKLLPTDWPGHAAYRLCRDLYRSVYQATRRHLATRFALDDDVAPAIPDAFLHRFGDPESRLPSDPSQIP